MRGCLQGERQHSSRGDWRLKKATFLSHSKRVELMNPKQPKTVSEVSLIRPH
ncbi:hypothetical protein BMETH_1730_1 [methanotrophic bacterial endosymbiont of Bathymodiolus sp.]|nr:hypothetical protein BMETH_1730_1 [methanotrophic bacterial endosymbiont of Bathymodiolus sp.]